MEYDYPKSDTSMLQGGKNNPWDDQNPKLCLSTNLSLMLPPIQLFWGSYI